MAVHNQSPTLGSENPKTQSKTTLNNSSANLSVVYTNPDNLINKMSELLTIISTELQTHDCNCFSNTTESKCHRGVVIYVKKYLNVTSFCINQNRLKAYSCCKIVLKDNTILYIICPYRSPNSTIDNNDLLNQTKEDVSKLKSELLLSWRF